jgi:hypothetical protein
LIVAKTELMKNSIQKNVGVIISKSGIQGWGNYLTYSKLKGNISIEFVNCENYQGLISEPDLIYDYYFLGNQAKANGI